MGTGHLCALLFSCLLKLLDLLRHKKTRKTFKFSVRRVSPAQGLENNLIPWNVELWQLASLLACQFLSLVLFISLRYFLRYQRLYLNSKDIFDITQEEQHHYSSALQPPSASEPTGVVVCCATGPWCLILQVNTWLIHPTAVWDHKYQAFIHSTEGHVHG